MMLFARIETATPDSSKRSLLRLTPLPAMAITIRPAANAPVNAQTGINKTPESNGGNKPVSERLMPRAAPEPVPSVKESASGFRTRICKSCPLRARQPPQKRAEKNLGTRICQIRIPARFSEFGLRRASQKSLKSTATVPVLAENRNITAIAMHITEKRSSLIEAFKDLTIGYKCNVTLDLEILK